MESTNYTFKDVNYTDYGHYAYALAEDKLQKSSVYMTPENRFLARIISDVLIFVVGLVGNTLTIVVISCNNSMKTVTNYYLLNLAVADLCLILNMILDYVLFTIGGSAKWNLFSRHYALCYMRNFILETLFCVTIMTITAVSIERYLAICKPFQLPSKARVKYYILGVWLIACLCGFLRESRLMYDGERCYYTEVDLFTWNVVDATVFFVLPMIVMTVLYILIGIAVVRSNRIQKNVGNVLIDVVTRVDDSTKKTIQTLAAVVIAFFLCWVPFHIRQMLNAYETYFLNLSLPLVEAYVFANYFMIILIHTLYVLSTVINPIIYSLMSKKFKTAFKEILQKVFKMKKPVQSASGSKKSTEEVRTSGSSGSNRSK